MRLLILIKTSTGGQWLVPLAEAAVAAGHDVRVLLPEPAGQLGTALTDRGVTAARLPVPVQGWTPRSLLIGLRQLRLEVARSKPDVLHYQLHTTALLGRAASLGLESKGVYMSAGPLYLENAAIRMIERFMVKLDHRTICSSSHLYARYRALGVPLERLEYLPYGVDLERFRPPTPSERGAARGSLGLAPEGFVAVCCAYFYPPKRLVHRGVGIKGHDLLLRAWAAFQSSHRQGTLLLAGGGYWAKGDDYMRSLQVLADRLGVADSVRWLGAVADVREVYRAADVSVCPSRSENLGAAAESAAMGLPIISSNVGGLPEVVQDGVTGWTYRVERWKELGELMGQAHDLGHQGRLVQIGQRSRSFAERSLDLTRSQERFVEILERVAGSPAHGPTTASGGP